MHTTSSMHTISMLCIQSTSSYYIYIYNITYLVRGKKIMNIMINLDDLSPFTVSGLWHYLFYHVCLHSILPVIDDGFGGFRRLKGNIQRIHCVQEQKARPTSSLVRGSHTESAAEAASSHTFLSGMWGRVDGPRRCNPWLSSTRYQCPI